MVAEISEMVIEVNTAGLDMVAAIIARLHARNLELERALTAVQTESTRQVEEIRALQRGVRSQQHVQIQMIDRYREFRAASIEVHNGEVHVLDVEGHCLMAEPVDRIVFARVIESQPGERPEGAEGG